jgi:hypothetical protein
MKIEDLLALYEAQGGLCAITLIPMTTGIREGRKRTNVSIDRIDSSKGYSLDNIQLVCTIVNLMKLDMTQTEFTKWCAAVADRARIANG